MALKDNGEGKLFNGPGISRVLGHSLCMAGKVVQGMDLHILMGWGKLFCQVVPVDSHIHVQPGSTGKLTNGARTSLNQKKASSFSMALYFILYGCLGDPSRLELQLSIEIRVEKKLRQVK